MEVRFLTFLLPLLILLSITSGCEKQTQYAILTTVFTGVPPMEELYGNTESEVKVKDASTVKEPLQATFKHPLWAAKQCTACHKAAPDAEDVVEGEILQPDPLTTDSKVGEIILPPNQLCIKCHLDKTARRAIRERLWMHNPVAIGDCLSCHSKHQSANHGHLKLPLSEICSSCHKTDQLPGECLNGSVSDKTQNKCLNCHNTHIGQNRFLLIRDYTETKIVAGPIPEPASLLVPPPGQNE